MIAQDLAKFTFFEAEDKSVVNQIKPYLQNALDGELNIIDSVFPETDVKNVVPHFELYALAQANGHDLPIKYQREICRGLLMAAELGQTNAVKGILQKHGDAFFGEHLDWALYLASEANHPEIVEAICQAKKTFTKSTPIMMAVYDATEGVRAVLTQYINLADFEPPERLYTQRMGVQTKEKTLGSNRRNSL